MLLLRTSGVRNIVLSSALHFKFEAVIDVKFSCRVHITNGKAGAWKTKSVGGQHCGEAGKVSACDARIPHVQFWLLPF